MAWFKKTRKPIASSTAEKPSRVPEGLWVKCPGCSQLIYNKDLEASLNVCPKCAHHFRISATERLKALFDDGCYKEHFANLVSNDPLQFTDTRPYRERLKTTIAQLEEAERPPRASEAMEASLERAGGFGSALGHPCQVGLELVQPGG